MKINKPLIKTTALGVACVVVAFGLGLVAGISHENDRMEGALAKATSVEEREAYCAGKSILPNGIKLNELPPPILPLKKPRQK